MGGNNSRLMSPSGRESMPSKFRPLIRQRIEEFRRRRNVRREESTLSKKELLMKDDDANSDYRTSDVNRRSLEETQPQEDEKTTARVVAKEKLSQVVPLSVNESRNEEEEEECKRYLDHDQEKKDQDAEKKIAQIRSVSVQQEFKSDDEEEEDDEEYEDADEDEDEDERGRLVGTRSPSFRIYCVETEERIEQELRDTDAVSEYPDEKENEDVALDHKSNSSDSDESVTSASENEAVKTETNPKKKVHQKSNKLVAMKKNLLNVKNLQKNRMNRMMGCAGNNDRANPMSEK